MVVYIDEFKCNQDIVDQFCLGDDEQREQVLNLLNSSEVLLAWYGGGAWDGQAMVVYKSEGKLYEVNGSHCSCYGLEGQWDPEETSYKALAMRNPCDFDRDWDFIDGYKEMLELIKDDK